MSGGGGGGMSGTVVLPAYMEDTHEHWLRGVTQSGGDEVDYSIVDLMNAAWSGATPYYLAEYTDPDDELDAVETAMGVPTSPMYTEAEALAPEADWEGAADAAETKATAKLPDAYIDTLITAIIARTDWDTLISAVNTKHGVISTDTYISTLINSVLSRITWATLVGNSDTKSDDLLGDLTAIKANADTIIDDDDIQALVDAFESDTLPEYQRNVSRFLAGMSDINAVNSSAFLFGMAILESERFKQVTRYKAELTHEMEKEKWKYTTTVAQIKWGFIADMTRMQQTGQLDASTMETGLTDTYYKLRESFLEAMTDLDTKRLTEASRYETVLTDSYKDRWARYQMAGIAEMTQGIRYKHDLLKIITDQLAESRRVKILATHEYESREIDLDVADSLYNLKVYQYGSNVMASPQVGATYVPEKESAMRSALGGVMAGAGAGAMTGGAIGGPPGAATGALIGGLLGIGQAFL